VLSDSILQWKMRSEDKDMIVMWNQFLYDDSYGNKQEHVSSLVFKGMKPLGDDVSDCW
jgi:hypothetical protein